MSEYGYDDRPRRHGSRRTREREPEYVAETTFVERGAKAPVHDLVYRTREDSIEDIPRDFPPPGVEYRQTRRRESYQPRRARSVGRRDYDDRSDYTYAHSDRGRGRYDDRGGYYSDDYDKPRNRRKSVVDSLKDLGEGLGLGSVIGAVSGHRSRSRSRDRSRHRRGSDRYDRRYSSDEYDRRSRSRGGGSRKTEKKWEQAAKAAIIAGAVEAFRSRKEPGPWTGEKGQRVATAALGAAGIDSLVDKDPNRKSKRHVAEAAIGGLIANRLANGARSQSRGRDGSRSRSRSRSGRSRSRSIFGRKRSQSRGREGGGNTLRDLAGAGALAAAGKAIYDRVRSKSRSKRDRSRSVSSEDSYVPSRGRNYTKSRSRDYNDGPRGGRNRSGDKKRDGSTDSESTTDMENRRKKLRAQPYPTSYADAIPYSAGVPPPPIGPPPARY